METYEVEVYRSATYWKQNGKLHRLDGPAVELSSGTKSWLQNGLLHRLDGPAIEWFDGVKEWYIDGVELTETEFNNRNKPLLATVVKVEGVEYTLS